MKAMWSLFTQVLSVLPTGARRFLTRYSLTLGALSILDALALGLLALVVSPLSSGAPLTLPIIGKVSDIGLVWLLIAICALIVVKGVLAVTALWSATRRFAKYELEMGARLFSSYMGLPWVQRLQKNSADIVRLTDSSVAVTISGFLLPASTLLGEVMSFVVVVAVLAIAKPVVALSTMLYLGLVGAVLFFWVTKRSKQAGRTNITYTARTLRLVTEMVGALKEITLRNKTGEVAEVVRENRTHTTRARSNIQFLGQVPRYVLESALIGGFVLIGAIGFVSGGPGAAVAGIALFGLAGFRMAPSVIRFQAVVSQVTANAPHAEAVVSEIHRAEQTSKEFSERATKELPQHPSSLEFKDVSFAYVEGAEHAVRDINLKIQMGTAVAFVGSSGSGKSTMIDLILGLIEPTHGEVDIDDVSLTELTYSWRSRVAYVPQDVALFDATIAQNVALTWKQDFDREKVARCLDQAQLSDVVEARDGGIDGRIGERGMALSGGQRQRLGIARALYADPLVLIMDEATSALDTATEAAITDSIRQLKGSMTVVTVAHRLATVQDADRIFFMSRGQVVAAGTFDELVRDVPEFAIQARLAGLAS
jgi:ABC-type bacteriocin/lantibiotic exporter with double-glycine peptidase domain